MKKKTWIIVGVVSVVVMMIGASVYHQAFAKGPSVTTANAENEVITDTLIVPGTLSLKNEQKVYPGVEGEEIAEILVKEGDAVEKGTAVAKYDDTRVAMELERLSLQIESGYLRINQVDKQLDRLSDQEKELRDTVGKKEAAKQIEPERDQLQLDLRMANLEVRQFLLEKKEIEEQQKDLEIKSKLDGTILQVNEDQPTDPMAQQPVIHIGNTDEMVARGVLSEFESLKVEKEMKATIRTDVLPDKEWKGKVNFIGLMPDENSQSVSGEATPAQYGMMVEIEDDITELRTGFQLIIEVETSSKKALTVPSESVLSADGDSYVYLLKDGKAHRQNVSVGVATGDKIEILDGITTDDDVITNPSDDLSDGLEVEAE